jgi:hypothetical protein
MFSNEGIVIMNSNPHQGLHCLTCDTTIFSEHRHDFKYCKCPKNTGSDRDTAVFVDGGKDYFRIGFGSVAAYEVVDKPS